MPIDSHQYLVKQGWGGKGTALRHGSLARPIAIPQKRTLAGVGKDRDDAFPFWDHLFTVAAKTIQVKIHKDSDDESSPSDSNDVSQAPTPTFVRTKTGILSNRRPIAGTPASTSGTSTPSAGTSSDSSISSQGFQPSIMSIAKREAAKRGLYMRFYRGPVLAPEIPSAQETVPIDPSGPSSSKKVIAEEVTEEKERKKRGKKDEEERPRSKERRGNGKKTEGVAVEAKSEKSGESGGEKVRKRKREGESDTETSRKPSKDESSSRKRKRKNAGDAHSSIKSDAFNLLSSTPDTPSCESTTTTTQPSESDKSDKIRKSKETKSESDRATQGVKRRKRKEEKEAQRAEREERRQRRREHKAGKEKGDN